MSAKPHKNPAIEDIDLSLQRQAIATRWEGPLPPPAALEAFDRIIPNGAERIMVMCEKEQTARIANDRALTIAEIVMEAGGRLLGAIALLVCIGAAIWSITVGAHWIATSVFLSIPIMGTVGKLFERGKHR